jgi:hypothetical protein
LANRENLESNVPRASSAAPSIDMAQLDAQLESIKNKYRQYKPSFREKCVEEGEETNIVSPYMVNPPRAFRLGEDDGENNGESASERRHRERKEREAQMAEERKEREAKMAEERREREEKMAQAKKEREEQLEKARLEREEQELKDLFASKKMDLTPLKDAKVFFVIGGPGSGKVIN